MREQEQISYEEICKLGFTVEESNCDSFFKEYGFPYKIFYLNLTKKIYIDWDQVTRVCKLVRVRHNVLSAHIEDRCDKKFQVDPV